jgi:hypothetical protein
MGGGSEEKGEGLGGDEDGGGEGGVSARVGRGRGSIGGATARPDQESHECSSILVEGQQRRDDRRRPGIARSCSVRELT